MLTIDECRRNAEQCLHWADEAANDQQRETLLEIARLWTQMELSSAEPNEVDGAAVSRFQRRRSRSAPRKRSAGLAPRHPRGSKAGHYQPQTGGTDRSSCRSASLNAGALGDQKSPALHNAR
jgi:hypothetical protein